MCSFVGLTCAQADLCRLAQGSADRLPANSEGSNSSKTESMETLLQAMRHEDAKVHSDIPVLLQVRLIVPFWAHSCI